MNITKTLINLPNIETIETFGCLRSTRNFDEVFVLTLGYHKPGALINVRSFGPLTRNSASNAVGDPHSASDLNPSVAI